MTMDPLYLTGLFPEEIAEVLSIKPFQGRQIFQWIQGKGVRQFDAMTNLSLAMRADLAVRCTIEEVKLVESRRSPLSSTLKTLLALPDGETIESVLIRDEDRVTLCVSSQAGCPLGCSFCATGAAGFRRDLTPGEIVGQALWLLREGEVPRTVHPNIVFMGMGEPFYNYDAVMKSMRLLMHPDGLAVGARRITLSTAGDAAGIDRFAQEDWQVRLSVSLHAANDALRSELVPLNRVYPLEVLKESLRRYTARTNRQITLEWTLIDGVNDSVDHARELVRFMKGLKAFVNLIAWNPVPGIHYAPASKTRCEAFREELEKSGIKATLRREKGGDIDAACGQLRAVHQENTQTAP